MAIVNSVLGSLDTDRLGFTLTHEHIFTASAGILQTYPELFGDFQAFTDQVVATLTEAHRRFVVDKASGIELRNSRSESVAPL